MSKDKIKMEVEIYADMDKLLDKIVDDYNLPDKSKAIRVLLDYVDEKENEWDEMFATVRCNRCQNLGVLLPGAPNFVAFFANNLN